MTRSSRPRPRVLVVASGLEAVGGIASYSKAVIDALSRCCDVSVLDLKLSGRLEDQVVGVVRSMARLARYRPDLVVLCHVGLGPIGMMWQAVGGRYAVLSHGIEIWGPRTTLVTESLLRADGVWPISAFTQIEVLRVAPGARVSPPLGAGIEERFFQERIEARPIRVLFVATLDNLTRKGVDTLIEAVERIADDRAIELRILGSGSATPELETYVATHDRHGVVRCVGRIGDDALLDEYRQAGVLVLLSRLRRGSQPQGEGLGLVLLEAAAAGVPVIGSDQGGSADALVPDVTGYLLPPGDVDLLTKRLRALVDDPALRERMGSRGRAFVKEFHSTEAFAARISAAVQEAIG